MVDFLFNCLKACNPSVNLDIEVVVSHGVKFHTLDLENVAVVILEMQELFSDHEETDTRLRLHANHAAKDYDTVMIKSPDTVVI